MSQTESASSTKPCCFMKFLTVGEIILIHWMTQLRERAQFNRPIDLLDEPPAVMFGMRGTLAVFQIIDAGRHFQKPPHHVPEQFTVESQRKRMCQARQDDKLPVRNGQL